jgi:hypothetical protein
MKTQFLIGIAALFLATGTAHAADICYEVLQTPDNFLATREHPTAKSKIIWGLREDDDAPACIAATQSRPRTNSEQILWALQSSVAITSRR